MNFNLLPKRARISIFIKLLGVSMVTVFAVLVFIGYSFLRVSRLEGHKQFKHHFQLFMDYVLDDIGTPPDTVKAKNLLRSDRLTMRYVGEEFEWASHKNTSSLLEVQAFLKNTNMKVNRHKHTLSALFKRGNGYFIFELPLRKIHLPSARELIQILIGFTFIFTVAFLMILWILHPIRKLSQALTQLKDGNLEVQIKESGNDELGKLTRSFNRMVREIKNMIQAKEKLLLDVSHELRSPLSRMEVALEFVPEGKNRTRIKRDLQAMENMITELLESERLKSRYGGLTLDNVELNSFIGDECSVYKEQKPGLLFKGSQQKIQVKLDTNRMHTVMKNLLENALKYSQNSPKPIEISVTVENNRGIISVKDSGVGIAEKHLPFLFEPFYRVDKSRSKETGGYGLGLNLCKNIITAHGGDISVTSSSVIGTEFKIALPL